jgi:hypothetical protein
MAMRVPSGKRDISAAGKFANRAMVPPGVSRECAKTH